MTGLPLVDGHLDLAENVTLFGRDLTSSAVDIRSREGRSSSQATVSLPDLERGGIAVVVATVTAGFLEADVGPNFQPRSAIYRTPEEAEAQALIQIGLYSEWERQGRVRLLKSAGDLERHLHLWQDDRKPGLVLLMEGADPIVAVDDLPRWWQRGLRMIGLTYGDTRYGSGVAGGSTTYKRGGLTPDGVALLGHMAELGFIWDISHLAEDGVRQGFDVRFPRVCASHCTARVLIPTDRHLSDDTIRGVAERGGIIGLPLYNGFLDSAWKGDRSRSVSLDVQLRRHARYVAGLAGWDHVGIGSDLDGGFGLEESPQELDTIADLYKVGAVVPTEGREGVQSANWLRFLRASLPQSSP